MKLINRFLMAALIAGIMACGTGDKSTEPSPPDPMKEFMNSMQTGVDSANVSLSRGGQAEIGFSLNKTYSSQPNIQIASLTEMKDLSYHISKTTADSFYFNVRMSNNSSLPSVHKTMIFNWISFPSTDTKINAFGGTDTFNYSIARGGSQINLLPFTPDLNSNYSVFSTNLSPLPDVQVNLFDLDSNQFSMSLLLSANSSSPQAQGTYENQWFAIASDINGSGFETGKDELQFSLSRGECVQKTINLSDQHNSIPSVLISNENAKRDVFIHLDEITSESFKINLCRSNNASLPSDSGVNRFSWIAVSK